MKISHSTWSKSAGWSQQAGELSAGAPADLTLVFGSTALMKDAAVLADVIKIHPSAYVLGCSTAGEISGPHVADDSLVVTGVKFNSTTIRCAQTTVKDVTESFAVGQQLAKSIPAENLRHVFVLSDGLSVNGSELVKGIAGALPPGVAVTGGLAGDGSSFSETCVCAAGVSKSKQIALVGFYGNRLKVGYGSMGGWDSFGPDRRITRSIGNVLYELDGRSALDLYKEYLGEHAAGLPASGLLFPLALRQEDSDACLVRTILAVDEKAQSMTFAGDLPEGSLARLMRANFDRLVDGAHFAATKCGHMMGNSPVELAMLISCVGRKLVLKQRIEEEVETVLEVLGPQATMTGFYSYGEISPLAPEARSALHNQTMTITTFGED